MSSNSPPAATATTPERLVSCRIDSKILNEDTIEDLDDMALSFFASVCGKNRGALVLDPPDGHTYGCLKLPSNIAQLAGFPELEGVVDLADANGIQEQYLGENITSDEALGLLDFLVDRMYGSSPSVKSDPYACSVNGLTKLSCGNNPKQHLRSDRKPVRSVTLTGVLTPDPLTGATVDYHRKDFTEMVKLAGLSTVQMVVPVSDVKNTKLASTLDELGTAGLQAILVLSVENTAKDESLHAVLKAVQYMTETFPESLLAVTLPKALDPETMVGAIRARVGPELSLLVPLGEADVRLPSSKRGGMMWKGIITIMLIPAFLFLFRQQTETRTENNIHDHLPRRNLGSLSEILERDFANLGSLSEILKFDYMSIQENGYGGGSSCQPQWGCLWNNKYCIEFKGQCAMHLEDIDSNCGQWAECAGVICSADYVVNGHMVCLARRKIVRDAKSDGKIAIVKLEMVDLLHNQDFGYMSIQENGYGGGSSCHPQWGCLWNDKYCIKFQGQCAMHLEDIDSNCGQWAECAGVICSADYVVNGHMVCLARREIVRDAKSDGKIAIVKSEMVDLLHNQDFGDDMSLLPGESGGGSRCVDGKCPWNDLICQNFQGQCAIPIQEIKTKCGNWDECKGVVCRKDYILDGINVCLARGAIDLNAVTPGMMSVAKPMLSTMDKDRHTVCSSHWNDQKRDEFEPKDTYHRIKTLQGSDSFFWTYERTNRYDKIVLANDLSKDDPKSHWRFVNEGRHGGWQIINRATGSKIRFDGDGTDDTKLALMPECPFLQGDDHNRKCTETLTFRGHCTNNKVRFDLLGTCIIFNDYDEANWVRPSGDMGGSSRTTLQALQLDASSKNQRIKWDWMLEPVNEERQVLN